jgi:hypothetical protein
MRTVRLALIPITALAAGAESGNADAICPVP